jgi:hypothetical protein
MRLGSRSWLLQFVVVASTVPVMSAAQRAWSVDRKESLAWWQMSPHFATLWGTTCPADPSWEAGEGAGSEWRPTQIRRQGHVTPEKADTIHVPLYPRSAVEAVCRRAVSGHMERPDTLSWTRVHGEITVLLDSVEMGSMMRDRFSSSTIFQTGRFPSAAYQVDSLVDITWEADTLVGTADGVVTIRGVAQPVTAWMEAWPDSGGMRVRAKLRLPAHLLQDEFGVSQYALNFGVGANLWEDLFMGVDLVLRPESPTGN